MARPDQLEQRPRRGHVSAFEAGANYTAEASWYSGELRGGPVLLTGVASAGATLTCRVQVNQSTPAGSGPSVSGHGSGVVWAGPQIVGYFAWPTDVVFLCAFLTADLTGTTYYWDADRQTWSTSSTVHCQEATQTFTP